MNVGIFGSIELHNRRAVSGIIPEVEGVGALGHMDDVLAVQGVVGHRAVDGFLYPHPSLLYLNTTRVPVLFI